MKTYSSSSSRRRRRSSSSSLMKLAHIVAGLELAGSFLVCCNGQRVVVAAAAATTIAVVEPISYIWEPFESAAQFPQQQQLQKGNGHSDDSSGYSTYVHNNIGKLELSDSDTIDDNDHLFGARALKVDYQVAHTESWGGFVAFGFNDVVDHDCRGATHMSLWYKILQPQSMANRVHLRLMLKDSSHYSTCTNGTEEECLGDDGQEDFEVFYSFHYILDDNDNNDDDSWQELRVELRGDGAQDSPFYRTGWSGIVGNDQLDLHRLRGWTIELSMDSQSEINATSHGSLLIDQLACVGGSDMLGTALFHQQDNNNGTAVVVPVASSSTTTGGGGGNLTGWRQVNYADIDNENDDDLFMTANSTNHYAVFENGMLHVDYTYAIIEQQQQQQQTTIQNETGAGNSTTTTTPRGILLLGSGDMLLEKQPSMNSNNNATIENSSTQLQLVAAAYEYFIPSVAYYNLSQVLGISLTFQEGINKTASISSSSSAAAATTTTKSRLQLVVLGNDNQETRFNFSKNLDDEVKSSGRVTASLVQDRNDHSLDDPSFVKGFRFEIIVESFNDKADDNAADAAAAAAPLYHSESIAFGNMTLITKNQEISFLNGTDDDQLVSDDDDVVCVKERGLQFSSGSSVFKCVEFLGSKCGELCRNDPDCLYALAAHNHCYMASHLDSSAIQSDQDTGVDHVSERCDFFSQQQDASSNFGARSFWMDGAYRRGDFCDLCNCRQDIRTIDCRGKNLKIIPKTFTPSFDDDDDDIWKPRVLDLRLNPQLLLLGSGSLDSIAETLEELWLPSSMLYIGRSSLPNLRKIQFEGREEDQNVSTTSSSPGSSETQLINVITSSSDFFGDICCSRGHHVSSLSSPAEGLTFCDKKDDSPGLDSVYEPFIQIMDPNIIREIRPSSSFMSEAAKSPFYCAEYCSISDGCNFFSYDGRRQNSEHICVLMKNYTRSEKVCCNEDNFADANMTIPGWTSGRPPRTRHELDNAQVLSTPQNVKLSLENGYETQFELSLGSTPLRGAVWVEPSLATSSSVGELDVTISPKRVTLYDATTKATITVKVSNPERLVAGEKLIITSAIQSCDTAFTDTTTSSATSKSTVYVNVETPPETKLLPVIILIILLAGLAALVYFYMERKKKHEFSVWIVKKSELHFDDPPEIIGEGAFGQVLKADYRGTKVAVKRIIPLSQLKKPHESAINKTEHDNGKSARRDKAELDVEEGVSEEAIVLKEPGVLTPVVLGSSGRFVSSRFIDKKEWNRHKSEFMAEVTLLSKLRHPCITTLMGAVVDKREEPMLVMEYMDHGSLYHLLRNKTMMLDGAILLPILRDIVQGVRFLHAASPKVIHGDLKAQNVLVDSRFRAKVADFGLSKKRHATGTLYWMAPELLRGESVNTTASDVYAFGIILCEVYSRQDPYQGEEDVNRVFMDITDQSINRRPAVPASCPPAIQSIMTDCLQADPGKRPTFEELDIRLKRMDAADVEPLEVMDLTIQQSVPKEEKVHGMRHTMFRQVFPENVQKTLDEGCTVAPQLRHVVTIFISDIADLPCISATMCPKKVSDMFDRLYHTMDLLACKHDVFKIETIADSYMAIANLVKDQADHTKRIAEFAIDVLKAAQETLIDVDNPDLGYVNLRIGFHAGPVVANVIGSDNPRYCLVGETVNMATKMETLSEKNRILCSQRAATLLAQQDPTIPLQSRGRVEAENGSTKNAFWVNEGHPKEGIPDCSKTDLSTLSEV